jgi:microcystin-dependent protein
MTVPEMPSHNHLVNGTNAIGDKGGPGNDYLAAGGDGHKAYHDGPPNRTMDPGVISHTGGGQAFSIQDPYLGMFWCIALQGVYPSRN